MHFIIALDGTVGKAESREDSTLTQPAFVECILGAVRAMTFHEPRSGEPVDVNYPFTFESPDRRQSGATQITPSDE